MNKVRIHKSTVINIRKRGNFFFIVESQSICAEKMIQGEKSPFGNHCNYKWFRQEASIESYITGESLSSTGIFT